MNFLINYLVFNLALAVSYVTARGTLDYCLSFQHLYSQRLKLARFALLAIIAAFWIMPFVLHWFAFVTPAPIQFQPFIRQASDQLLGYYTTLPIATTQLKQTVISMPDLDMLIIAAFITAINLGLAYQCYHAYRLLKLVRNSYIIRKIHNANILASETIQVPICFSFINKSYVILPDNLLANHAHYKIVIAHELQHIRQKDTRWLYLLTLLKVFCVVNPAVWLWSHWFNELQEFACDETVMRRNNTSAVVYGECLLTAARNMLSQKNLPNALGLFGLNKTNNHSNLYRRIDMLFHYRKQPHKSLFSILAGILLVLSSISTAYALNGNNAGAISLAQLQGIVTKMNTGNNAIQVTATPEVLAQLNTMRTDPKARQYMTTALHRLAQYQPMIQRQLKARNMPNDLLALPLTESGYQNLDASKNIVSAAGIWQVVPNTAHKYGLVINDSRDDRLTPADETKAALNYLQKLHTQFNDWNLALIAYEIGEDATQQLINKVGSRNSWDLARSSYASEDLKKYLPALNASIIIMQNPTLLND